MATNTTSISENLPNIFLGTPAHVEKTYGRTAARDADVAKIQRELALLQLQITAYTHHLDGCKPSHCVSLSQLQLQSTLTSLQEMNALFKSAVESKK